MRGDVESAAISGNAQLLSRRFTAWLSTCCTREADCSKWENPIMVYKISASINCAILPVIELLEKTVVRAE